MDRYFGLIATFALVWANVCQADAPPVPMSHSTESTAPPANPTMTPDAPTNTTTQLYELSWPPVPNTPSLPDALGANLLLRDPFLQKRCTFQFMGGYYQKTGWGPGGPAFNYTPIGVRYGFILTDPCDDHGLCRGCIEALLEVNYSPVLREFGSYATGPNLMFRYNFVQQQSALVPYVQAGAGLVFTDAWKDRSQDLIGGELEFLLRGEIGARLMLSEAFSIDGEFGFQHISNATIAKRNGGINNLGIGIGFTYFFGRMP